MEGFKHLVIVKFKEDVPVDDIIKGMEKLVSEIDSVKSFEWQVLLFLVLPIFLLYLELPILLLVYIYILLTCRLRVFEM